MARYLDYLDTLKTKFISEQTAASTSNYPFAQFYYYQDIVYTVDPGVAFMQTLCAVKLINTAVLFVDQETDTKVYFTDNDIASIIASINDPGLKEHIKSGLKKVIDEKCLASVAFIMGEKTFDLEGIQFKQDFNEICCENPADINMNGNDLIALINCILEKDRADKNPRKVSRTAKKYLGLA